MQFIPPAPQRVVVAASADLHAIQPFECAAPDGLGEREASRIDQLTAEAELVDRIMWAGYAGKEWECLRNALAEYGLVVCRAWIANGQIFRECARKGIRLPRDPRLAGEAQDVAVDTVIPSLSYFRERVLIPRVWAPERGASLKTFFVGACVLHFRNAYRTWRRQQIPFSTLHNGDATTVLDDRPSSRPDKACAVAFILHDIEDPLLRRIGAYIADGYTQREAAELLGMTESAVRSKLERFRNDPHE